MLTGPPINTNHANLPIESSLSPYAATPYVAGCCKKKLQEKRGSRGTGHTAASSSVRVTCHMHMWSTVLQTTVLPSRLEKKYTPRDVAYRREDEIPTPLYGPRQ
jgi:hypothetical protein